MSLRQSYIFLAFILLVFLSGCAGIDNIRTTAYVPEGEYLLRNEVKIRSYEQDTKTVGDTTYVVYKPGSDLSLDEDLLREAIQLQANSRMIIPKTYLHLYNFGRSLEDYDYLLERLYNFISPEGSLIDSIGSLLTNKIGEPPALLDSSVIERDMRALQNVYFSKGFFHADVAYIVEVEGNVLEENKAEVTYFVQENEPFVIQDIRYEVSEYYVSQLVEITRGNSYLKIGERYDESNFDRERGRIVSLMRDKGFYKFSADDVTFTVDTTVQTRLSPEVLKVHPNAVGLAVTVDIPDPHELYRIREVTFIINPFNYAADTTGDDYSIRFRPSELTPEMREVLGIPERIINDTSRITFKISHKALEQLNLNVLTRRVYLEEGDFYSVSLDRKTRQRLQDLGIFRRVFVQVIPVEDQDTSLVDVEIYAELWKKYQARGGVEGFFMSDRILQSNLPGVGGNLSIKNRNLFGGGEVLEFSSKGNFSFYFQDKDNLRTYFEVGANLNLSFPRFLLPFTSGHNLTRFSPRTNFGISLTQQARAEFSRTLFGLNWNYTWYHSSLSNRFRSSLSPFVINFIRSDLSEEFKAKIETLDPFLRVFVSNDFKARFSTKFNYTFRASDYGITRTRGTDFFEGMAEFGGNTPYLIDKYLAPDGIVDQKIDLGEFTSGREDTLFYGQFWKVTAEYRRMIPLRKGTELIWRVYTGVSLPWNLTTQVPFEFRMYGGGTNSMRGWLSNTLGPGTWSGDAGTEAFFTLLSPGGEFGFETNLEYRADVIDFLEIAFFTDLGNVWFLTNSEFTEQYEGGRLTRENFYLGWDAGIGFRFDFDIFVFRMDIAQQLYAPDIRDFVIKNSLSDFGGGRARFNFGIGYPF